MRNTRGRSRWVAAIALAVAGSPAASQTNEASAGARHLHPAAADAEMQQVVISGYRQSLQDAQSRKRASSQIVDSIVADAIGKLPDTNTAEALQRVPGVQINTDLGEGASVAGRVDSDPLFQRHLSAHLTLTLAGTNLTRAKHQTFIGSVRSPSATYIDDRQYLAGVRYRF
jgi:outer membrane receptor for ferrienterochelin and colicin